MGRKKGGLGEDMMEKGGWKKVGLDWKRVGFEREGWKRVGWKR